MSWLTVLALGAGAYAFKAIGLVALGGRRLPPTVAGVLALLPAALMTALIVVQTFDGGRRLTVDARAAGVAVAGVAAWRQAPFPLVIVLGAAVTAVLRRYAGW